MLDCTAIIVPLVAMCGAHAIFAVALRTVVGGGRTTSGGTLVANACAYNLVVTLAQTLAATLGVAAWLDGTASALDDGTFASRLYSNSDTFAPLLRLTASYEVYNTIASLALTEYRTAVYIGHHLTTLLLAMLGDNPPLLHYFGFFFFGVVQLSSAPLALGEVAEHLGATRLHLVCKGLFAVFFLIVRTVIWPLVSLQFWRDTLSTMHAGGRSLGALTIFLAANIFLTGLQFLWTGQIVRAVRDMLSGGPGAPAPAAASKSS